MSKPKATKKAKPAKKAAKSGRSIKEAGDIHSSFFAAYEEIEFVCPNCGKKVKMIKTPGLSVEGMLCQKCGQGEEKPDMEG